MEQEDDVKVDIPQNIMNLSPAIDVQWKYDLQLLFSYQLHDNIQRASNLKPGKKSRQEEDLVQPEAIVRRMIEGIEQKALQA
jgi:hypothetical protein